MKIILINKTKGEKMSEMFPESKQPKVYRNGKTYLENVNSGLFQHRNALKFQTEMQSEMKARHG